MYRCILGKKVTWHGPNNSLAYGSQGTSVFWSFVLSFYFHITSQYHKFFNFRNERFYGDIFFKTIRKNINKIGITKDTCLFRFILQLFINWISLPRCQPIFWFNIRSKRFHVSLFFQNVRKCINKMGGTIFLQFSYFTYIFSENFSM